MHNATTCSWDGCESTDLSARGLCPRDYMRAQRAGRLNQFKAQDRECFVCGESFEVTKHRKVCCTPECTRRHKSERGKRNRIANLPERSCGLCQEPIPSTVKRDAKFCSVTCQQANWYRVNDDRLKKSAREWARGNPDSRRSHHARRRARKFAVPYEDLSVTDVFERDGWVCWLCGDPIDRAAVSPHPLSASLDHVVPLSRGGHHVMSNVAAAHLRCNCIKKDRLVSAVPAAAFAREE